MIRQGTREAKPIDAISDGSIVTLHGQVHSWAEKRATDGATWSARGVIRVNSQLSI